MDTTTTQTTKPHAWETAGLGTAPFRLVGHERRIYQACPGAPIQPGTSCDYCGTGISDVYWCQGSAPTDERFKVGCDCVRRVWAKGTAIRAEVEREVAKARKETRDAKKAADRAARKAALKAQREHAIVTMHNENPGLAAALKTDHPIVRDIADRATMYPLSAAQIALVFKLAAEAAKPAEVKVEAPTGRHTFRGEVVKAAWHDSMYGETLKITVKVTTPAGVWLAWGTCPREILDVTRETHPGVEAESRIKGRTVEITGTLSHSDSPSFAFFKRPNGKVV